MKGEAEAAKVRTLRENMPGYILGGELTPFLSDAEVLEVCELHDRLAQLHNKAFEAKRWHKEAANAAH